MKINQFGIVPIGILSHIYANASNYDEEKSYMKEHGFTVIEGMYNQIRHLFAMELVQAK